MMDDGWWRVRLRGYHGLQEGGGGGGRSDKATRACPSDCWVSRSFLDAMSSCHRVTMAWEEEGGGEDER